MLIMECSVKWIMLILKNSKKIKIKIGVLVLIKDLWSWTTIASKAVDYVKN
jgi:hypothetical protein